mmetsp:Transcript_28176/g.71498  ORF Transcript_28176/g.71498 Transcript_28176/m.71498 type:complete len:257 (-) Transcript_28176:1281-2051(-)
MADSKSGLDGIHDRWQLVHPRSRRGDRAAKTLHLQDGPDARWFARDSAAPGELGYFRLHARQGLHRRPDVADHVPRRERRRADGARACAKPLDGEGRHKSGRHRPRAGERRREGRLCRHQLLERAATHQRRTGKQRALRPVRCQLSRVEPYPGSARASRFWLGCFTLPDVHPALPHPGAVFGGRGLLGVQQRDGGCRLHPGCLPRFLPRDVRDRGLLHGQRPCRVHVRVLARGVGAAVVPAASKAGRVHAGATEPV